MSWCWTFRSGRSGLEILKELESRPSPGFRCWSTFSMHSEEQYPRRAFKAGASGYITKDSPRAELVKAVQKVMAGAVYVSPEFG